MSMLKSVLIVDDSEDDQYLLKRLLSSSGIADNIYQEADGKEAIRFLTSCLEYRAEAGEKVPPQVVFLDINMPILDGFGFLEEFSRLRQSNEHFQSIVIIMFTTSESEHQKRRASEYSFVRDFIVKFPTKEQLLAVMQKHFS